MFLAFGATFQLIIFSGGPCPRARGTVPSTLPNSYRGQTSLHAGCSKGINCRQPVLSPSQRLPCLYSNLLQGRGSVYQLDSAIYVATTLYRTPPLRTQNCVVDAGVEHARRRGTMYSGMRALRKMCAIASNLPLSKNRMFEYDLGNTCPYKMAA